MLADDPRNRDSESSVASDAEFLVCTSSSVCVLTHYTKEIALSNSERLLTRIHNIHIRNSPSSSYDAASFVSRNSLC